MMRFALLIYSACLAVAAEVHPIVFLTPEDVARGRANVSRLSSAKAVADKTIADAKPWLDREDDWFRHVVPSPGAAFAYGFTGCPICNTGWGTWGSARASFDNPGHVTCLKGHILPDADHPDPGTGYVGPDKRIHYFVGSYNAWVVETLQFKAVDNLAFAYTLTGEDAYAAKAGVILDAIAAVYPSDTKGSWDHPANPPKGRMDRPQYQVARVLIHFTNEYDQIYNSKSLDEPSTLPGLTRRKNIEENLLKNGAEYCYRQSQAGGLNNGEADYIRGALAVGVCLHIPQYLNWALDGPYGIRSLAENNIDRDGLYFETSSLYADHTRGLYFTFLEPLLHSGVNLWNEPKLMRFFDLHNLRQSLAGHLPSFGDTPPDTKTEDQPSRAFDPSDYDFLERLSTRTNDCAVANDLRALGSGPFGGPLDAGLSLRRWLVIHGTTGPSNCQGQDASVFRLSSDLFGQKGVAILRTDSQAVLLRYGPSLNHGHWDDLNINYVARGREVTYDLGYRMANTHTQEGWARQTASHNVVVVDERPQLEAGFTGGSLHLFADQPGLKLVEASSEMSYAAQHVAEYRRTVALIGEGPAAYLLDIFRVDGGSRHDWFLHGPGEDVKFEGVSLGQGNPGSLAGPEISWGDKQLNDGNMRGYPNKPYWDPPPGNGYGFLTNPRHGDARGGWSADWTLDRDTHMRIDLPADPTVEIVTAVAPGILPISPKARYVVLRRRGGSLRSRFIAVIEPYAGKPDITAVERLGPDDGDAVAVKVQHASGTADYVFSSTDDREHRFADVTFAGRFALLHLEGLRRDLSLIGATHFQGFGKDVRSEGILRGSVTSIDVERDYITTSMPLPQSLRGSTIIFRNPSYSRSTAYRIASIEKKRVYLSGTTVLGKGRADSIPDARTIVTSIPHEYARSVRNRDSGFFQGKLIRAASGAAAHVESIRYGQPMTLVVDNAGGFRAGETFFYYDLQVGDSFEIMLGYGE